MKIKKELQQLKTETIEEILNKPLLLNYYMKADDKLGLLDYIYTTVERQILGELSKEDNELKEHVASYYSSNSAALALFEEKVSGKHTYISINL